MAKYKTLKFDDEKPEPLMGKGDYANLPQAPKFMKFGNRVDTRSGIPNSFTCTLEEVSGVDENEQEF